MGEKMLQDKLQACRIAYEEEFEILAKQFEEFKIEVDIMRNKQSDVQSLVAAQESQIAHMNNMIESVGHNMHVAEQERRMDDPIDGNEQEDLMNYVSELNDNPDSVHPETIETIEKADKLLASPFSFYGFSLKLNIDDQIDIANRAYIRYYKKKINECLMEKDAVQTELESNQRMMNQFRQA